MGLSTLYLTSYATGLKCIALENVPEFATIARQAFAKEGRNPVDLRIGNYKDLLPQALNDINSLDFVFFNTLYEQHNNVWLFNECTKHIHNDTIFVFEGIKASPQQEAYRNKMEFSFGDEYKDGPLALGMHRRGSFYDIVTVDGCCIVDEDYRKILRCVRDYFSENAVPFYHKQIHQGYLRHLLVRKGVKTGDILIDLVTTSQLDLSDVDWVSRVLALELSGTVVESFTPTTTAC